MDKIDAGHPTWMDEEEMFRFDPKVTLQKPPDIRDAIQNAIRLQNFIEMYAEYMQRRSGASEDDE